MYTSYFAPVLRFTSLAILLFVIVALVFPLPVFYVVTPLACFGSHEAQRHGIWFNFKNSVAVCCADIVEPFMVASFERAAGLVRPNTSGNAPKFRITAT